MSRFIKARIRFLVGLVVLTACEATDGDGGLNAAAEAVEQPAIVEQGGAPARMMTQGGTDGMRTHMDRMAELPTDRLGDVLPVHRQMVENMLARMERARHEMDVTSDAEWHTQADVLRQDLVRMGSMTDEEMLRALPEHTERITDILDFHARTLARSGR